MPSLPTRPALQKLGQVVRIRNATTPVRRLTLVHTPWSQGFLISIEETEIDQFILAFDTDPFWVGKFPDLKLYT